jgi:membrane-bound lytic murein transglycosylase A
MALILPIMRPIWAVGAGLSLWVAGLNPIWGQRIGVNFPKVGIGDVAPHFSAYPVDDLFAEDRERLLQAIAYSLRFMQSPQSQSRFPVAGISHRRVWQSLIRFEELVRQAKSAEELQEAIAREFVLLKVSDRVLFTGYYEPVFRASRVRTGQFRYAVYRLPPDFHRWSKPHPTRAELERSDRLKGLEIAWLADPFEAFLVQVQGSARLDLGNGQVLTVGYAGKTDQPYTSVGRELVKDGKMKLEEVTLQSLQAYFRQHPQELIPYLHRNKSFVFFRETNGQPAIGSLGVPVTAERSIATDKSLLPPGAIALIHTELPFPDGRGGYTKRRISRFVLDQDTGSAIRGLNRVDIFMGTGAIAQERAGLITSTGALYYLLLRD